MKDVIKKEGRIGTKKTEEIKKLKDEGKLLESFFSIVLCLQYRLQANFHNKLNVEWNKGATHRSQTKNIKKLWEDFTKSVDKFHTIIAVSYFTNLIDKSTYDALNSIRELRNQIAHKLIYYEPRIFVTKHKVTLAIEKGIELLKKLEEIQKKIVFSNK